MQNKDLYILEHLKTELELLDFGSIITEQENINILRAEIRNLGRAGNSVLLEAMILPYDVEPGQRLFQLYSTIAVGIDDENLLSAILEINKMNVSIPLGTLGIFNDVKHLYHKYSIIIEEEWSQDTVKKLCSSSLFSIMNTLDLIYDEAIIISNNVDDLPRYRELLSKEAQKKAEVGEMLGFDKKHLDEATINKYVDYLLAEEDDDLYDDDEEDDDYDDVLLN